MIEHHHADVLREMGRLDEAIELAQAAVDRYREHPDWPPREAAHARRVLAAALSAAGRPAEALAVKWELVQAERQRPGTTPAGLASALAAFAAEVIAAGDRASLERAERALRECLEIRQTVLPAGHPQVWLRHNAMSMLGEVLVAQAADAALPVEARIEYLREAEPLLLEAWEQLKDDPNVPPASETAGQDRKRQALERIVKLYESWNTVAPGSGKAEQAAVWRAKLSEQAPDKAGRE
jgi:tetratricopeptide (TPR) repeat protein